MPSLTPLSTQPFLVFSTPGQLHIWSSAQDSSDWRGHREINLRTVNMTIGSTSVAPLVGVSYGRHEDNLVITLADGSFHVIAQFSTNPTLQAADGDDNLTAEALSAASRSAYLKVEERQLNRTDVNRIGGMVPFDNCATYAWFHEYVIYSSNVCKWLTCTTRSSRPTSFDYKHDARHTSTLVVARLWQDSPDEEVQNFLSQLATVKSGQLSCTLILSIPHSFSSVRLQPQELHRSFSYGRSSFISVKPRSSHVCMPEYQIPCEH